MITSWNDICLFKHQHSALSEMSSYEAHFSGTWNLRFSRRGWQKLIFYLKKKIK